MKQMGIGMVVVVGLLATVGCGSEGGLSPREGCEQLNATLCERIYACYTADEIAASGFPSSEAACVTAQQQESGCAQQTTANACTGSEKYHADQAGDCVDQLGALSCSQFRDPQVLFNLDAVAPACSKVCVVD